MADTTSIGIVGTGWVGTSVAISTLHAGAAQELLLEILVAGLAAEPAGEDHPGEVVARDGALGLALHVE